MLPMFDNRYLYMAVNNWYKGMALPTQLFKFAADLLDEHVTPPIDAEMYGTMPLLQKFQRGAAVRLRVLQRLTQSYNKPEWGIRAVQVDGRKVAVQHDVVLDMPFCKLLHFRKQGQPVMPKLLLIAPWPGIMRPCCVRRYATRCHITTCT